MRSRFLRQGVQLLSLMLLTLQLLPPGMSAQPKQGQALIDSLQSDLNKTGEDTLRCRLLNRLCYTYGTIDAAKGIEYGSRALELGRKLKWEKGIADALYYRGSAYLYASRYPEALEDYFEALPLLEKLEDPDRVAGLLSNIGGVYTYQNKLDLALEYFFKALHLNRMIEEASNFEVANLANIGSIYMEKQDYANALKYYDEALRICEKGHHDDMLYAVLTELSTTHLKLKDNRKTLQYAVRGLDLSRKAEALNWMGNAQLNIGTALLQALQANEGDLTVGLPGAESGKPLLLARAYLDSAVEAFTASGQKNMLKEAYHKISSLEEYEGNYRAALLHFKRFKEISDTVFNEGNREKVLQATLQHDFEQKEAVTKAAQDRKDLRQRVIRNSIAAGLLSVLIFAVVVFRQRNRISAEKKRSEDLLLNILPVEVAEELKVKGKAEAKHFDEVTMMFTDFRDFTLVAERMSPSELVNEIDLCFRAFDEIISRHGIEKIKTIGDAYMCAAGLPVANTTHASDMAKAAMEIRSFMQKHRETREAEGKHGFEIRIGIHTGPVVAGVVGTRKFAYDVWGDAVNTASRMESSGEAGQINISGSTFEKVRSELRCRHRGKISAKNKGEIDMYFVEGSLA